MKYNRIILSAVITLVMMLAPLPCFGKTDVLQYTADSSNAESWQSCDSSQSVTFEQNKKIYLRFSAAESTESGTSSQEDSGTAPVLRQRSADTSKENLLQPDSEGLYLLNTDESGSWEILYEDSVRMRFTVKEANAIQPPSEKPSKPKSKAGVLRKGKYYFYRDSKGKIRKKAGFVTWNGNKYYVRKGGRIQTGKTFKVGKYTYRANKKGQIKVGVYKWGKSYYYSSSKGRLRKSKGFVTWKKNRYYIRKGGKIQKSKSFRTGKYTYRAGSDGRIKVGVYKWGKYYYYSTSTGKLRKKAGRITWKGKSYYSRKSGTLYTNRFYFSGSNIYYAGPKAAALTGTFKVGKYTYTANASGSIISSNRKYMKGIDVSYYQGKDIDWAKVKSGGISFAFLRCGYSGTKDGKCHPDSTFNGDKKHKGNIQRATAAGVDVGAYYFSQARTVKEAQAEAAFAVKQVKESGCKLNLPLVIDTENYPGGRASSSKLNRTKRTAAVKAFCDYVKAKGYTPMIYASTSWLNNNLDMKKLSGYRVWVAQYNDTVTYKGSYRCWQYTSSGKVPGISGRVDLNYWTL